MVTMVGFVAGLIVGGFAMGLLVGMSLVGNLKAFWQEVTSQFEEDGAPVPEELCMLMEDVCRAIGLGPKTLQGVMGVFLLPGDAQAVDVTPTVRLMYQQTEPAEAQA